ncbi:hypothetical protein DEW08_18590 [Azospirillum thermophilum]|uniref:Uncharacterized protein n=2 Tax=Azospirillum thermophilum TaxID=2202148 RepID=A0A2S2CUH7_9PROT|nr:hypothetical protein DEW08_18590 [Azospirillum thermophilum]
MLKGKSVGPLRAEQFPRLAEEGLITHRSLVRQQGTGDARPLYRHPDLVRAVFGRKAPLVSLKGRLEDARTRPLVGVAASLLVGMLATFR